MARHEKDRDVDGGQRRDDERDSVSVATCDRV